MQRYKYITLLILIAYKLNLSYYKGIFLMHLCSRFLACYITLFFCANNTITVLHITVTNITVTNLIERNKVNYINIYTHTRRNAAINADEMKKGILMKLY